MKKTPNKPSVKTASKAIKSGVKKVSKKSQKTAYAPADGHVRPDWDSYFMSIAETVGRRGTCNRGRSGCVIVRDKHILVTGYVGSPAGLPHCDEVGHEMHKVIHEDGHESQHCIRTIHAEQNAVAQAARLGISLEGGTVYCKMTPCYVCAKILLNCGIKRIVAAKDYHASMQSKRIFKEAKVGLDVLDNSVEKYKNM